MLAVVRNRASTQDDSSSAVKTNVTPRLSLLSDFSFEALKVEIAARE